MHLTVAIKWSEKKVKDGKIRIRRHETIVHSPTLVEFDLADARKVFEAEQLLNSISSGLRFHLDVVSDNKDA